MISGKDLQTMSTSRDEPRQQAAREKFLESVQNLQAALERLDETHVTALNALADDVHAAWRIGGKLLVCGNGGSAADSQHIVAELVGRFLAERPGYPALALTTNSSIMTAVSNDYGFEHLFARQIQALGGENDVLLVISTSGNSPNCLQAVAAARRLNMKVHGFLGGDGGRLLELVDSALVAPSDHTPRIQEIHISMGHVLCQVLETWQENAE
jgi:D-sedoheptulose 7-phosphate isomerase